MPDKVRLANKSEALLARRSSRRIADAAEGKDSEIGEPIEPKIAANKMTSLHKQKIIIVELAFKRVKLINLLCVDYGDESVPFDVPLIFNSNYGGNE